MSDLDVETLCLLRAARETGVLDALMADAGTPAEVAAATGVTEHAARVTVRVLADAGFLERVDEEYEPTNRALGFLTKRDPRSVGTVPRRLDLLDAYLALPGTMASGDPPDRSEAWTANRLGAVAATDAATVRAVVTAVVREAPDADHVIDLGGAPGTYAVEVAERGYDVTLAAGGEAAARSRPFLAHEPVSVVEAAADGVDDADLPDADLAYAVDRSRDLGTDDYRAFVRAAHDALAADGTLVLVETPRESAGATAAAVEALATTGDGDAHSLAEYRDWLQRAGFEAVTDRDVPGTDRRAVVGTKRAID